MDRTDRELLDQIAHAVFAIEPDEEGLPRYAAFNKFGRDLLGKSEEEILGLTAKELYPGRLGKIAFDHHAAALTSGLLRTYDILLPIKGAQHSVQTTLVPVTDDRGRVKRLIGSSVDVSGSQIIREMHARADAFSDELEDFVSLAAHDLRTPIQQVHSIAEMLREDFKDLGDGKLELIDVLEDLATKATTLISDVISHGQATSLTEKVVGFDFADLVNEIMSLLDPMEEYTCTIDTGHVVGDRTATQIILRNLIDNAIKHARSADGANGEEALAPDLRLTMTLHDTREGAYEVCVRDNGRGFPSTALQFLDGGKLSTDSGFGLLGIRRLIRSRGGTLSATNDADGTGAVVSFSLPGHVEFDRD